MFIDVTENLNLSLKPELRKLALYLRGERADITVKGEADRWIVVLYENSGFESHMLYLWYAPSRELALRLARHLQGAFEATPEADLEAAIPPALRQPGLNRELLTEDLLPA